MKLTALQVKKATEPGKYHDGGGLGLFLRVRPNGSKFWVQRITINAKRCELGLGSPPIVSLAEAREQAFDNKRLVRAGKDPLQDKREAREHLTFEGAVDKYLSIKLDEFKNEKHCKQWRSTLETYANPVIGKKHVSILAVADVLRVLEPIWKTKTETASRLRGRIEAVLSWATVAGFRSGENPARWKGNLAEVLPKPTKISSVVNHPALSLTDAPKWCQLLRKRSGMAAAALEFAVLTAARSGEVRGMQWSEVDLENQQWVIPAERMKARREHRVPLSDGAMALIKQMPRLEGSDYVFFSSRGGSLSDMSLSAVMRKIHSNEQLSDQQGFIDTRSGKPAVPHGLRSTFRDWCAERTEFPRDMAEIALAHNVGSAVERAYRRSDMLEKRRSMMQAWATFLTHPA